MKLSKEELKSKYNEMIKDNDILISLLEDIEDSMEVVPEVDNSRIDELQAKLDEITEKYKERFLKGEATEEVVEESQDNDGLQEEEYIDVKEI